MKRPLVEFLPSRRLASLMAEEYIDSEYNNEVENNKMME